MKHWPKKPAKLDGDSVHCHEVMRLRDRKGGDPAGWPEDLRVRQWPGSASNNVSSNGGA